MVAVHRLAPLDDHRLAVAGEEDPAGGVEVGVGGRSLSLSERKAAADQPGQAEVAVHSPQEAPAVATDLGERQGGVQAGEGPVLRDISPDDVAEESLEHVGVAAEDDRAALVAADDVEE